MGKIIKYNLAYEVNVGTDENPIIEKRKGASVEIVCHDKNLEANLAIARKEAFEDPVVDEDGQPVMKIFSAQDDIDTMLVDHELRLTMLELDI